jgi:hypothetical protein
MLAPPAGHYIPSGHLDHVKEVLGAAPPGNSVDRKVSSLKLWLVRSTLFDRALLCCMPCQLPMKVPPSSDVPAES